MSNNTASSIRYGTSSFSSNDWVGPFYPQGTQPVDFLKVYAEHFDTVEIDTTYYAIPSKSTVEGWAGKVPDHFTFAAKFPRSIVHGGQDAKPNPDLILQSPKTYELRDKFLETMALLGNKLGPLLIQFPYFPKEVFSHYRTFFDRLDQFLSDLPKEFRYAVELRNNYWMKPFAAELLRSHNTALVLSDYMWMPLGDEIEKDFDPLTTDFSYIRLIGNRKKIEAITKTWSKEIVNQDDRLNRWASFLHRMAQREGNIFVYVNNHYTGHAPATVRRLRRKIDDQKISLK
ncbi:DUF72 domain-containing protein [bacterium]|nr:DUF72 domain-containing protein [bacterium]